MKTTAALLLAVAAIAAAPATYPDWAYAVRPAEAPGPRDDGTLFTLPGSDGHFTRAKIMGRTPDGKRTAPADWYPGDHPAMPAIVSDGDETRGITPCIACHNPNGRGRPQNAGIAGLNADYLARQLHDMKAGLRRSAEPRKHNARQMVDYARAMTEAEIVAAAHYYAGLPPTPRIEVVETKTVPKMRSAEGMWLPLTGAEAGREPIGNRVIETPANVERELLRDPRGHFIAYVPPGAVARGKRLAAELGCAACHGETLTGIGPVPGIAGRSPSYAARQLYDFQQGTRRGEMAAMMAPVAAKLNAAGMVNLTAYLATLPVK